MNATALQKSNRLIPAVLSSCLAAFVHHALALSGDLDLTFGGTGKVITRIGSGTDFGSGVVVQPDGKIVVAGGTQTGNNSDFAVVRYNTDGSLDTGFNGTGKVTTPIGSADDRATCVALQGDGKIIAAGFTIGSNLDVALVRYNSNGILDASFKGTGKVTTAFGSGIEVGTSVAVQRDGKIVVAGYSSNEFAVVRYNADGNLDTSFNGTGKVTTAIGSGESIGFSMAVQNDDKIVVGGYSSAGGKSCFALVRYNANGSLDATLGGTGKVTTAIGNWAVGTCVAVQRDGKIVLAGYVNTGSNTDFALARYEPNGLLDPTFNGSGIVTTPIGSGSEQANAIAIQNNGKIVVAGHSTNGSHNEFAILRYGSNGTLDTSFNGNGIVITDFNGSGDQAAGVALQSDGKIVAVGQCGVGTFSSAICLARYLNFEPDIAVEQPAGNGLTDGSATPVSFGSAVVGSRADRTFTVRNSGTASLTGLAVRIANTGAPGDFVLGNLEVATLAPNEAAAFTIGFAPIERGIRTAVLEIASDDEDESPFEIVLSGAGLLPEIAVEQPAGTEVADGLGSVSFGGVNLGTSSALTFTIRNIGTDPLTGLTISKNGSHAAEFTVGALGVTTLDPGASRTFTVTFAPVAAGTRTAAIHIASNDADENPFDINLTGTGVPVPEIVVEQPAGTVRVDGSSVAVDFGKVTAGTSVGRMFTIRNTGTADLTGIAVTLSGGNAAGDYSIWDLGATTLAPGTATSFNVFFSPGGPGARTATLLIASNDEDENPFEIALTGMRATPQLDAWRQTYFGSTANSGPGADLSDPDRDGVLNLMEFATGSGPWVPNGQPGELVKNGSSLEFTWLRRKTALAEISYAVEWSESLTWPWSAAGVSTAVLTDGSVMQEMKSTLPAGGSGRRFVRLRVVRL